MVRYDAGKVEATTDYVEVIPEQRLEQLMVYVSAAGWLKANGSDKEIYLPAEIWTPVFIQTKSFEVKMLEGSGMIYWQGWFM